MRLLILRKDGVNQKINANDAYTIETMLNKGFKVVGEEDLGPSAEIAEAVNEAIKALDIDGKIATAVETAVKEAIKSIQMPTQVKDQKPEQVQEQKTTQSSVKK